MTTVVLAVVAAARPAAAQSPSPLDSATLRRVLATEGIPVESVGDIHQTKRYTLVDTHINPSAGTIIVLTRESKRVTTLDGWVLRVLPTDIVLYHRSNVHFAPTHWTELRTWDPATRRDARLYTSEPSDSLKRLYVDARLGDTIVVAPSGRTVAFMVTFSGDEGTQTATRPLDVAVVCRNIATRQSRCTERPASTVTKAHPGWTPVQILNDLAAGSRE